MKSTARGAQVFSAIALITLLASATVHAATPAAARSEFLHLVAEAQRLESTSSAPQGREVAAEQVQSLSTRWEKFRIKYSSEGIAGFSSESRTLIARLSRLEQKFEIPGRLSVPVTGLISGRITIADGDPLPGAAITAVDEAANVSFQTRSDMNGEFSLSVAAGSYTLDAVHDRYASAPLGPFPVDAQNPVLGVELAAVAGGAISGRITSTAAAGPIWSRIVLYNASGSFVDSFTSYRRDFETNLAIAPGTYFVVVESPGHQSKLFGGSNCPCPDPTVGTAVNVTAGEVTGGIVLALDPGGSLRGVVRDPILGTGISNGFVSIYDAAGTFVTHSSLQLNGSWSAELAAGTYYLIAFAEDYFRRIHGGPSCPTYAAPCDPRTGTPIVLVDGTPQSVDIDLGVNGGYIEGTIRNANTQEPLEDADVHGVFATRIGFPHYKFTQSRSDGSYTIVDGPMDDGGGVDAFAAGFFSNSIWYSVDPAQGERHGGYDLALQPRSGVIEGLTYQEDGSLSGGVVTLHSTDGGEISTAGSDGKFVIAVLDPGTYFLSAKGPYSDRRVLYGSGICPRSGCDFTTGTAIVVEQDSRVSDIHIQLAPPVVYRKVSGKVRDAMNGALIQSQPVFTNLETGINYSALVSYYGDYSTNLPTGSYSWRVEASGYLPYCAGTPSCADSEPLVVADSDRELADVSLTSVGGRIYGRVSTQRDPLVGTTSQISFTNVSSGGVAYASSNSSGHYVSPQLVPGTYVVTSLAGFAQMYDGVDCGYHCYTEHPGATRIPVSDLANITGIDFSFIPMTLSSVKPSFGPLSGGTVVTIEGHGFELGSRVRVGGTDGTVLSVTPNKITIQTPAGVRGAADVVVIDAHGLTISAKKSFTFTDTAQLLPHLVKDIKPGFTTQSMGTLTALYSANGHALAGFDPGSYENETWVVAAADGQMTPIQLSFVPTCISTTSGAYCETYSTLVKVSPDGAATALPFASTAHRVGEQMYYGSGSGNQFSLSVFEHGIDSPRTLATTAAFELKAAVRASTRDFLILSGSDGLQIWQSNGTAATTSFVTLIELAGFHGAAPVGNDLSLLVTNTVGEILLFTSDGTEGGTKLVKSMASSYSGGTRAWKAGSSMIYLWAPYPETLKLWRSDGTTAGTAELAPALQLTEVNSFTVIGENTYFRAHSPAHGYELFVTDGTDAGTSAIEFFTGSEGSLPSALVASPDLTKLFFVATHPVEGRAIWQLDGASTTPVKLITLEGAHASANALAPAPSGMFFSAGGRLYWTDYATIESFVTTSTTPNSSRPGLMGRTSDKLFFEANAAPWPGAYELWASDGTSDGTVRLLNLHHTDCYGFFSTAFRNKFHFLFGCTQQLWTSDGTAAGTKPVFTEFEFGQARALESTADFMIAVVEDNVYRSDGTAAGTYLLAATSEAHRVTACGDRVYYATGSPSWTNALWVTDGTVAGTKKLIGAGAGSDAKSACVGSTFYFTGYVDAVTEQLYATDGTTAGTRALMLGPPVRSIVDVAGEAFILRAPVDGALSIWTSNGTVAGTTLYATIGTRVRYPSAAALRDRLIFSLSDPEMAGSWTTIPGERRVEPIGGISTDRLRSIPGMVLLGDSHQTGGHQYDTIPHGFGPAHFPVGDRIFMSRYTQESGRELWAADNPHAPHITSVVPSSGDAGKQIQLTLQGGGFAPGMRYNFDFRDARLIDETATAAIVEVTPRAPGQFYAVGVTDGLDLVRENAFFSNFLDVPQSHPFQRFVEKMARRNVTAGCGNGNFCPAAAVTRAQLAVFLLVTIEGSSYVPPPATGLLADMPVASGFAPWVEELWRRGITAGCGANMFCPSSPVSREQAAVLLLRALEGNSYAPPPATGIFSDVPSSSGFGPWIEELARRGVVAGCGNGKFCPGQNATRGQLAVMLAATFGW